ncbi:MAG: glycosyltransferase family 39 protein [Candidatus Buchananbacteria bacterium]
MLNLFSQKSNKILLALVLLAIFLRLWGLAQVGLQNDAAVNSVRAVGWFDFLAGKEQTSPLVWFGHIPWWANLSFHDHPPLVYFIQFVFFRLFGATSLIALLPFALAGIFTLFVLYFLLKLADSEATGLLAAAIFTVSSYATWITRTGYLEGVEILFIAGAVYFLVKYTKEQQGRYLYLLFTSCGLALISKYTAVFLLPAVILFFLIWRRNIFKKKEFWLSLLLLLTIVSPVIFYNIMVFRYRGHFDAAFSSMIGMNPSDYQTLSYRHINFNALSNIKELVLVLYRNNSWPWFVGYFLALAFGLWQLVTKKDSWLIKFSTLAMITIILMYLVTPTAPRFLSIVLPFFCINAALATKTWYKKIFTIFYARAFIVLLVILFLFELFYNFNTNVFRSPVGRPNVDYSASRFYDNGFEALHKYIRQNIFSTLPSFRRISSLSPETTQLNLTGGSVVLFDERVDWFSRMWYIDRYIFYYNLPIVFLTDLENSLPIGQTNGLTYLGRAGVKDFWLVSATGPGIISRDNESYNSLINGFEQEMTKDGILPVEIKNYNNQSVFKIYHFKIN